MRSKGLWIPAAMGLVGLGALLWMSHSLVGTVTGAEEALQLQEALRAGAGSLFDAEPPLRVLRAPGEGPGAGFRWRVEATLREGLGPDDATVSLWRERTVARALGTRVQGRAPAGVLLVFHRSDAAEATAAFDAQGRPVPAGGGARR